MNDRPRLARRVPGGALDAVIAVAGLVLLGATAFGLWHVVVGGLVNGNPRAGAFGVGLALAAGIPLAVGIVVVRRRAARDGSDQG
jgi:drug/metabolite transporter (DMT)-like permease